MGCMICGTIERLKTATDVELVSGEKLNLVDETFAMAFVLGGMAATSEAIMKSVRGRACEKHREVMERHFLVAKDEFLKRYP